MLEKGTLLLGINYCDERDTIEVAVLVDYGKMPRTCIVNIEDKINIAMTTKLKGRWIRDYKNCKDTSSMDRAVKKLCYDLHAALIYNFKDLRNSNLYAKCKSYFEGNPIEYNAYISKFAERYIELEDKWLEKACFEGLYALKEI